MYEEAGLSSLERLVGKHVSSICFLPGYVQIRFEDLVLTCYTNPSVTISGEKFEHRMQGFKDALCTLIGKTVQSAVETLREELAVYFDDSDWITISLRFADATSVEAAMLSSQGGAIYNVWRYE